MNNRAISRSLPLLLAVVLTIGACATARPTPSAPAPLPLKLVLLPFLSQSPFYIALEEGYFTEQGLAVETVPLQVTQDAFSMLAAGQVDVLGGLVTAGNLNAIARGANIRIVADKGHVAETGCDAHGVVARSGLLENGVLKDPTALRGMHIDTDAYTTLGFLTEKVLGTVNLTLDDVETVTLGPPAWLGALQQGSVDMIAAGEPWTTRIAQDGAGQVWMGFQDVAPGYQFAVVLFAPSLLGEDREAGKRFMVAYLKAVRQYNEGKTERNLNIIMKHLPLERELLQQACWDPIRSDGDVNVDSLVEYADWSFDNGLGDSRLTADQLFDSSFIEYANQVLGPAE
jgi:NitT/TauT family transport system substrate-binding protein